MSSSGGIGSTLTGGIQDISVILPLLGTEQCSEQVSSALTRGYLYAASTPMSSVRHGCDKPQGDTGRGMAGWGQGMKKSTREKPQPLWRVHG